MEIAPAQLQPLSWPDLKPFLVEALLRLRVPHNSISQLLHVRNSYPSKIAKSCNIQQYHARSTVMLAVDIRRTVRYACISCGGLAYTARSLCAICRRPRRRAHSTLIRPASETRGY